MANIIIWWPILDILTVLNQPFSFKNIGDAQQAIQEHSVATNSSFSVFKTEKDFNLKGNIMIFIKVLHIDKDKPLPGLWER